MNAVEYIKQQLTKDMVVDIISSFGATKIEANGEQIRSTCPIHLGNNPTAFVWKLDKQIWYCFTQCKTGGDIFDLVAEKFEMSEESEFSNIVRKTAHLLGIDISNCTIDESSTRNRKELREWLKYMERKMNREIINSAYDLRSLGEHYRLNSYRTFGKEFLQDFGVTFCKTLNRVSFPIYREDGVICGASLRRIDSNDTIKWLHRPKGLDTGLLLYNLDKVKDKYAEVYIVEGIPDTMNLVMLGVENVVATFGANLTEEQVELIIKYFTGVTLLYDGDKAGKLAIDKAINLLRHKCDIKVIDLSKTEIHDAGEIKSLEEFNSLKVEKLYEYLNLLVEE